MKTIRERFRAIGEGSVRFMATRQEVLDFIEQELKKEREEIVEMIEELAEPYDGAKWLNQVNPETIINAIKNRT